MITLTLDHTEPICAQVHTLIQAIDKQGEHLSADDMLHALQILKEQRVDIIFICPELYGSQLISTVRRIEKQQSAVNIIFMTACPEYALDAHRVYCSAFLTSPISPGDLKEALEHLRYPVSDKGNNKLRAMTFGSFMVLRPDGEVMRFSRTVSKEILAYLIDQCGYPVTSHDIAADVFGITDFDAPASKRVSNSVRSLLADLKKNGLEKAVVKQNRQLQINKDYVSCDLYDALSGSSQALALYKGEYMIEYSWSETSFAMGLLYDLLPDSGTI